MNAKLSTVLVNFFVSTVLFLSVIMGLAMPVQTAQAAALCVEPSGAGGCYTTIQAAINAASPGDTINVAAGTYAGQILVNKSVTILGDPGDASPGPGLNAPIIDGGSAPGDAFLISNGVLNVTIQGFEMRNFTSNATGIGNGISAWEASTSNITIQDNYFHNLGWNGVLVGNDGALGDSANWTIKGNILETFVAYGFELTNASNSSVENNVIHSDAISDPSTCIMVDARRNETGITIKNNQIDGPMPTGIAAVFIFADSFETPNANLNNVLVEGNTISTIGITQNDLSPKILENTHKFTNRLWALRRSYAAGTIPHVWVYNYPGTGTITGVQIHTNSLSSLKSNTPALIDAIVNWWGDLDPSDNVIGNVDYSPWCTDASCTLFAPPFATTTTITADTPDPSAVNQIVSVTATVAGLPTGAPTPTGTVTVFEGVASPNITANGVGTYCTITLVNGAGLCNMTFLSGGVKNITALYSPNNNADFSTSSDTESHIVTFKRIFKSQGANDGWILESSRNSSVGGTMNNASAIINVGDDAANKQYRAILHFDTSTLPDAAVVTSAMLKIKTSGMVGTPFIGHGNLVFDIRKPFFGATSGLALNDFQAVASKIWAGPFSPTPVLNWYTGKLTAIGRTFVNTTGTTQFRLRFGLGDNHDAVADYIRVFSGDSLAANRPQLIIQYYMP